LDAHAFLTLLEAEFPLLVLAIVTLFALVIGSFLNVLIHRLPIMLQRDWEQQARMILSPDEPVPAKGDLPTFNLFFPNSHCPTCTNELAPWENIPVVSYLALRGRCAHCKAPISVRYPLVELTTAVISCVVVATFGLVPATLAFLLLSWALLAIAMIDYDLQIIPDDIALPLLWLGLVVNVFGLVTDLGSAVIGAATGYLSLWSLALGYQLITGREGMGHGDFKLLAMLGAWMGWQALPLIVILSSFSGALIGGALIVLGRDRLNPIPFGPFLALAGWIALLWGEPLTRLYLRIAHFQ